MNIGEKIEDRSSQTTLEKHVTFDAKKSHLETGINILREMFSTELG